LGKLAALQSYARLNSQHPHNRSLYTGSYFTRQEGKLRQPLLTIHKKKKKIGVPAKIERVFFVFVLFVFLLIKISRKYSGKH